MGAAHLAADVVALDRSSIERVVGGLYDLARSSAVFDVLFRSTAADCHEVYEGFAVDPELFEVLNYDIVYACTEIDNMACLSLLRDP